MNHKDNPQFDAKRRKLFKAGLAMAGGAMIPATSPFKSQSPSGALVSDHRSVLSAKQKLGKLEVSSIGLGVQNMHRKHNTIVPYRPEMIELLWAAYDEGISFFDCAEAYGPHENERILGEAIESFRDDVVITSKFGWNIDLQTGERLPGLNSKPAHIKLAVEGSLRRLRTAP